LAQLQCFGQLVSQAERVPEKEESEQFPTAAVQIMSRRHGRTSNKFYLFSLFTENTHISFIMYPSVPAIEIQT
jgi:hypothetical protein